MLNRYFIAVAFAAAAASPLSAQRRETNADRVPPGHMPPPGMCRIWIDGVPPAQQPAPTDCATAVRNRPANARVIFGSEAERVRRDRDRDNDRDDRRGRRDRDADSDSDKDSDSDDSDDKNRRGDRRGDDRCIDANRDGRCDDERCIDANRDGRCDYDRCIDNNRDGRCDDERCIDANRDGRCDDIYSRAPHSLPEMIGAILIGQGQRTQDVNRWLGGRTHTARYDAVTGGAAPQRVTWLNSAGQIAQVWVDNNRDGRADYVDVYRGGKRVRTFRR